MSSQILVCIPVKDYLGVYCTCKFGDPVRFSKGSHLNVLIFEYLMHKDYEPGEEKAGSYITLELPRFRRKNVEYYNHISQAGQLAIRSALNDLMFVEYFRETLRKYKKGETVDSAIWHFIESYGLPASCFDTFRKRIQREMSKLGVKGERIISKELECVSDLLQDTEEF